MNYLREHLSFDQARVVLERDEKDGKEYYDRSVFISDLDDALAVAKQHDQIAIWDNANRCEVYVDYSV